MKSSNAIFLIILSGMITVVGCTEKNERTEKAAVEEGEKEDTQFKPGIFMPGKFEPGTFEPGTFKPGTFIPGTFTPGNFDPSVTVAIEENEIVIEVPSHLLFDFDKSELKTDVIKTLDQLSDELNEYDGANVLVIGHTDNQGDIEYNQNLSESRAHEVHSYLKKKVNVEKINLEAKGYGQTKPMASNETEEGREKNRRVEIIVEPLVKK